jgi:hypothetical protein
VRYTRNKGRQHVLTNVRHRLLVLTLAWLRKKGQQNWFFEFSRIEGIESLVSLKRDNVPWEVTPNGR